MREEKRADDLRRGWTTGACATAAVKAAVLALREGAFPKDVTITLPKGEQPVFPLALRELGHGWARVGIVKDAGDDPDVTHGALVIAKVTPGGQGVRFKAGEGVGTVTKPGLPIGVGEAAINPAPRAMIQAELAALGVTNAEIEVSIPGGEQIAAKTWNGRLGIVGGLSILGTTGIVHPFSCAAWIASIHRGIDVARASGLTHVAGCTGSTSEDAVRAHYHLPLEAMLDMGDFAGGVLKYLRSHPVARLTIAGGFGKICKLAQGHMDLHSSRSQVDLGWLSGLVGGPHQPAVKSANTALEALTIAGNGLADQVAELALNEVRQIVADAGVTADVMVVSREGKIIAHAH